mmetsp:Transcript_12360/g.23604  ORF Transcript_12360/g.23604 Transcript_12360/m.23604 type:complete len:278 (-) Transcript_12360:565-1398(-)
MFPVQQPPARLPEGGGAHGARGVHAQRGPGHHPGHWYRRHQRRGVHGPGGHLRGGSGAGERFAAAAVGSSQFFGVLLPGAEAVPGGHGGHVRRAAAQVQDHGWGDAPARSSWGGGFEARRCALRVPSKPRGGEGGDSSHQAWPERGHRGIFRIRQVDPSQAHSSDVRSHLWNHCHGRHPSASTETALVARLGSGGASGHSPVQRLALEQHRFRPAWSYGGGDPRCCSGCAAGRNHHYQIPRGLHHGGWGARAEIEWRGEAARCYRARLRSKTSPGHM